MPVRILPQDTITPALQNVFSQLSGINAAKIQEETRKRNELAQLTELSLQNISNNDNAYLQKQKDEFVSDAAKRYGENKGYLPYDVQADLNTRKSNIMMEAKASEEWKKQYEDVVKQMATNDKIDKEKTAANLKMMMTGPNGEPMAPSQRMNPYNAVRLNFDTNEYIRQNLNKELSKRTEFDSKDKRKIWDIEERTPADVLGQLNQFYAGNPSFKKAIDDQIADSGFKGTSDEFLMQNYVPTYVAENKTFKYKYPSSTTINNNYGGGSAPKANDPNNWVPGQAISVSYKNVDGGYSNSIFYPSKSLPTPPAAITVAGNDITYGDNTVNYKSAPAEVDINGVQMYKTVLRKGRTFIVPKGDEDKYPDAVEMPYFVGSTTTTPSGKTKKATVPVFIPVTEERKRNYEAKLGTDAGKQPYKLGELTNQFRYESLSDAKQSYPDLSDEDLKKAYFTQYGIILQ